MGILIDLLNFTAASSLGKAKAVLLVIGFAVIVAIFVFNWVCLGGEKKRCGAPAPKNNKSG